LRQSLCGKRAEPNADGESHGETDEGWIRESRLGWCEEGDLNPYALSGTSPSN
jgi:hypothetical protein